MANPSKKRRALLEELINDNKYVEEQMTTSYKFVEEKATSSDRSVEEEMITRGGVDQ